MHLLGTCPSALVCSELARVACYTLHIISALKRLGVLDRSELAVTAALLHDVVDDTPVTAGQVEQRFGGAARKLVATVTQLSQMNQLMRRKQRHKRERVHLCHVTPKSPHWLPPHSDSVQDGVCLSTNTTGASTV